MSLPCPKCLTHTATEVVEPLFIRADHEYVLEKIARMRCTCGTEFYSTSQAKQLRKRINAYREGNPRDS